MFRDRHIPAVTWLLAAMTATAPAAPTNTIIFVGDGMGFEHVKAARMYYGPLIFETLPYTAQMTHNNASDGTTDSAASATAMATGHKVNNGVISVKTPGDGSELTTVLERLSGQGKRTGLVTAHTVITDATPAGFGAHAPSRSEEANIADDYLTQTRPNVLFGLTQANLLANAPAAGYTVVTSAAELAALDTNAYTNYAGLFSATGQPTLAEMTSTALDILDNDPDGFFLLVENEETDTSGHENDLEGVVKAILDLDDAVMVALNWAATNGVLDNTLILFTADHETGGLTVLTNNGLGVLPAHMFSTSGHTQTPVPVYAIGSTADAARVTGTIDNTDIFYILNGTGHTDP